MNLIKIIAIVFACLICFSCEKINIEDVPAFDNTAIVSFKAYDTDKSSITKTAAIINEQAGTVTVPIKEGTDLSQIFATCGLSSGATLTPALEGYSDWSAKTKTFTVTSASGKRSQQWTITFQH